MVYPIVPMITYLTTSSSTASRISQTKTLSSVTTALALV